MFMTYVEPGGSGLEKRRPLSPHLQIYRPMLTMIMSIAHRITGAALYFGTLLLAWLLIAASTGADAYATAASCVNSLPGKLILFGFTWALFHHLLGGIRHVIWDSGHGFCASAARMAGAGHLDRRHCPNGGRLGNCLSGLINVLAGLTQTAFADPRQPGRSHCRERPEKIRSDHGERSRSKSARDEQDAAFFRFRQIRHRGRVEHAGHLDRPDPFVNCVGCDRPVACPARIMRRRAPNSGIPLRRSSCFFSS